MPTYPIVGAFYRPPAKALLEVLAVGTPLTLIAEPENAYDANAIAVWLAAKDIPSSAYEKLEETLPPFGFSLEGILDAEDWHLGYIPKELAAELRTNGTVKAEEPVAVLFCTAANGTPRVQF